MHLLWDSGYFSTIFWTPYPLLLSRRLSKFFFKNLVLQKHPLVGAKQLYWNQTSAYVFSCKFAAYIQKTFFWEHFCVAASDSPTLNMKKFECQGLWNLHTILASSCMTIVHAVDFYYSLFIHCFFLETNCGNFQMIQQILFHQRLSMEIALLAKTSPSQ